jgi:hypothetical protein
MYYHQFSETFEMEQLAAFLAERIQEKMRVVIVSRWPDDILASFKSEWKKQYQKFMLERDNENNVSYQKSLSAIVAKMQSATVISGEMGRSADIAIIHPLEITGQVWEERQIIVCCDGLSLMTCTQLLSFAQSDFTLLASFNTEDKAAQKKLTMRPVRPLSDAALKIQELLEKQIGLLAESGLKPADIIKNRDDIPGLLKMTNKNNGNTYLVDELTKTQRQIANLRVICGRLRPEGKLKEQDIRGLKLLTRYLGREDKDIDSQLFDDPLGLKRLSTAP